jgi:hypothetical protein
MGAESEELEQKANNNKPCMSVEKEVTVLRGPQSQKINSLLGISKPECP